MTEIAGLPLHPLVVHVAVVLLPLSALAYIVIAFVAKWRKPFDVVVFAGLVIGTVFAIAAKLSGEALAEIVGNPAEHAEWGNILPWVSIVLCIVAGVWLWAVRKPAAPGAIMITGVIGSILAVAVLLLSVIVGHSGAEAVWAGTIKDTSSGSSSSASPSASASQGGTSDQITFAQVKKHNSPDDCWSAVNGTVYNLTDWIAQHPGGEQTIIGMCGTDASATFDAQHGGQGRPERELKGFAIGSLITDNATPAPSDTASAAGIAMSDVKQHASAKDCWSAVAGNVYDLTQWIAQHPGGEQVIIDMCGKDATDAFAAQHGGQGRPERELGNFLLGPLA